MTTQAPSPWYKQFWPWFLLGLLFTSIFGSSTLAVMAVRTADGLVQQDYYEHGRAINMVLAKQQRAEELGLAANLRIDPLTSDVIVQLDGDERPERLYVELIFPTLGGRDQSLTLEHVGNGRYLGQAPDNLRYRWYLQLHPSAEQPEWRLVGEGSFPSEEAFALTPGLPTRG
ncbi:FixH family protein [Halomonas campisalis]|uniref:FixH family protein n=1 Tax=Billgrantia campisalis TaxID=74661 RepID=A0ABS9P7B7_9GAMM|nr:FixH family protein [Halomonas campisalis]MCG6657657.1 FixH family protein [Halomonas campisalis]MDR5862571.1 FixH family protein [Halomonas campisalis]